MVVSKPSDFTSIHAVGGRSSSGKSPAMEILVMVGSVREVTVVRFKVLAENARKDSRTAPIRGSASWVPAKWHLQASTEGPRIVTAAAVRMPIGGLGSEHCGAHQPFARNGTVEAGVQPHV